MAQLCWQLQEEAGRNSGTHLVLVQEQLGDAHVPVLQGIHEGSDPTAVPAVSLVLAPANERRKHQHRTAGSSKIPTGGDSQQLGLKMGEIKLIYRPWINLSWCLGPRE